MQRVLVCVDGAIAAAIPITTAIGASAAVMPRAAVRNIGPSVVATVVAVLVLVICLKVKNNRVDLDDLKMAALLVNHW